MVMDWAKSQTSQCLGWVGLTGRVDQSGAVGGVAAVVAAV